jgi:hypothetical protein
MNPFARASRPRRHTVSSSSVNSVLARTTARRAAEQVDTARPTLTRS